MLMHCELKFVSESNFSIYYKAVAVGQLISGFLKYQMFDIACRRYRGIRDLCFIKVSKSAFSFCRVHWVSVL